MINRFTILVLIAACLFSGQAAYGATFGNTAASLGSSELDQNLENNIRGQVFTLSEAAIPTSMTAIVIINLANKNIRMAIVRDSDEKVMAETQEVTVTHSLTEQTVTCNFLRKFNLPAGDYRLCAWTSAAGGVALFRRSATTGGSVDGESEAYVAVGERYPASLSLDGVGNVSLPCIYCTYTAGTVATFGHEQRESEQTSPCENDIRTGIFTSDAVACTADTMYVWISQTGGGSGETPDLKGAIYRVSDDSLMDSTAWITYSDGDVQKWYALDFLINRQLAASTEYNVAVWSEASTTTTTNIQWLNRTGEGTNHRSLAFAGWPGTSGTTDISDSGLVSMYVKYTEVVAASSIKGRRRIIIQKPIIGLVREATETFAGHRDAIED